MQSAFSRSLLFFFRLFGSTFNETDLNKLISQQLDWDSNPFRSLAGMTLLLSVLHLLIGSLSNADDVEDDSLQKMNLFFTCEIRDYLELFGMPIHCLI